MEATPLNIGSEEEKKEFVEAPHASNEARRLLTLQRQRALDISTEESFDRITHLTRALLRVPTAILSFIDAEHQWIKAPSGLKELFDADFSCVPRAGSFCSYTLLSNNILTLPDVSAVAPFKFHDCVTKPPHIRFYSGAPLITSDGYRLGTLCVLDVTPRDVSADDERVLADMSKLAVRELETRNMNRGMLRIAELGEFSLELKMDLLISECMRALIEELNLERVELLVQLQTCVACTDCEKCGTSHVFKLRNGEGTGILKEGSIFSDCHAHFISQTPLTVILPDHSRPEAKKPNYISLPPIHHQLHSDDITEVKRRRPNQEPEALYSIASKSSSSLDQLLSLAEPELSMVEADLIPMSSISVHLRPARAPPCILRALCSEKRHYSTREVAFFNSIAHVLTIRMDREFAENKMLQEKSKVTSLLLNVLPQETVLQLQSQKKPEIISVKYDTATVLFADLVGFTELSSRLPAVKVVSILNDIFSALDLAAERNRMEKIKTIGDAYMAAAGVPKVMAVKEQGFNAAMMALEIPEIVARFAKKHNENINVRVGIHTGGPVVAGVIGVKKFCYDMWGDSVNTASRMESTGIPGKIQVSDDVYQNIKGMFDFEVRGPVNVKVTTSS
eukprot:TRINITY_DN2205_c0_g1_i4.p1 TRINITY_DN2205_c0_g1~~TRINITY_DN2205_c0_g1_i4.p1  ORF type:complete len:648 (+),score=137.72 TRINITY_DN2205_c0_g1_i4:82-1944(+)